ncbi:MAG: rRNA maturation RNase YbeY [Paramuribaculum sp.]|nr:rRNA maturation RNase YbeY [Paramuribaculum sp.]
MKRESITFSTEEVDMPAIDSARVHAWLCQVAENHGLQIGRLNYVFCDDDTILRVNREFLGHDYFTDIITFDYTRDAIASGDIYISLDTVATNAELNCEAYSRELHRVIAHGLLHLCGIDDKGAGQREIMERHEDQALALLETLNTDF